ncbi:ATP-binding protein [Specibacter sp. NPDC057265]|uniref:ATP-binding protein n=1 Tax=Specibacter sp. NPDC057265 TaxID=3346075 RepID=UPI00362FC989
MDKPLPSTTRPATWRRSLMGGLVGAEGRHHLFVRQLPLVVVMAIVTVLMAAFYPAALVDPFYLGGLALLLLSLVLSAFVPWSRLPPKAMLLLPIIDILAVGAARAGEAGRVDVFGLLVVFPAIWLATVDKERGAWVATAGMALIIMAPIFFTEMTLTPQVWTKLIMLPVTIAAVGLTVSTITLRLEASAQENRQQRELLHSILQAVDVGVVALDTGGRIIVSNDDELAARARAAATALGGSGSSAAAAAAMAQTPIFEPDGKTAIPFDRRPLVRAVRGEYVRNYLFWDRRAGARVARYATSGPVHDDSGEVVGCVLAFSDVTPLMKAAAAQSAFVAAVSHELRTPLTAILGYTDLLRERLEDDGGPPAPELAVIERGAHRLRVIVEDLLTAASSDMSMTPVRLDLAEAIHSAMVSLQPVAQAAQITLEQHTPAAVPALVDPERIGQLLDNLLSNAIKYSPAGTTVVVGAWIDAAAKQLVVEVRDQGRGITAEDAALVFDPFYRSQSARESAIPGAGLGLSVAKSIAERHGGSLRLHSTEGVGTTAELRLPAPD